MAGEKALLSVAIITRNEEDRLPDCLSSVAFADEVVVVDSESTDRTVEIARDSGARVLVEPWRGFGPQKQFAIEQCRHQWILVLDADERLPAGTAAEIARIVAGPVGVQAYSIARKNYFLGRWIRHGSWWPDRTVRLFRKDAGRMAPRLVHEALEIEGAVGELENPMVHFPFRDLSHMMAKMDTYSTMGAVELHAAGRRSSMAMAFCRAGWTMLYNYLLRGGFLDGGPGLVLAVSDAVNIFFKHAKLRELQARAGRSGAMGGE